MESISDPLTLAFFTAAALVGGTIVGALFGARFERAKGSAELERVRGAEALERTGLHERLNARETTLAELKAAHAGISLARLLRHFLLRH
ncbi:MAG: hypothetical protein EBZ48_01290 [Proteobacteria bacterium]|nr:hypothetical protein [Pseudomonadota bacterium]